MLLALIIGSFCLAYLLSWGLSWLSLTPWRRSTGQHWAERARLLYPTRISCGLNTFLISGNIVLILLIFEPALSDCALSIGLGDWLCALLGTFSFSREIFPELTFQGWLQQICAGLVLRLGIWFVYLGSAVIMPKEFGWPTVAIAGAAFLFHLVQLQGWGLKLLQWTKQLLPADERLGRIVAETSARMGVPVRNVWRLGGIHAQAYAMPTTRELLFGDRLLAICDDREIASICAHELAHLTEPRAIFFRRVVASFTFFPLIFVKPAFHGGSSLALLLLVLMFLLMLIAKGLSQRMEKRADQMATENQEEAGVYGRALEKLYRENLIPAVGSSNRQSHPHLYDRLLAAGITPDYPRPKPAKKLNWSFNLLYVLLIVFVVVYVNFPND